MSHLQLQPNGMQQFCDGNGEPLALGTVGMYVPNTMNEKDTWQDKDHVALNTNPIELDAAGRAVIWGSGTYRQILLDVNGALVWDKLVQSFDDEQAVEAVADALSDSGDIEFDFNLGLITGLIKPEVVTNTKLADMPAWTFKVRNDAAAGVPQDADSGDFTTESEPAVDDFVLGYLSTGEIRKFEVGSIGGLTLIERVMTTGSQASVSFQNIPSDFSDLIISIQGRLIRAGQTTDQVMMRFNNDAGANYFTDLVNASSAAVSTVEQRSVANPSVGAIPASNANANFSGQINITINNYVGTTFNKNWTTLDSYNFNTGAGQMGAQWGAGMWNSTVAINRVDLLPQAGTGWVDGSVISLYGRA